MACARSRLTGATYLCSLGTFVEDLSLTDRRAPWISFRAAASVFETMLAGIFGMLSAAAALYFKADPATSVVDWAGNCTIGAVLFAALCVLCPRATRQVLLLEGLAVLWIAALHATSTAAQLEGSIAKPVLCVASTVGYGAVMVYVVLSVGRRPQSYAGIAYLGNCRFTRVDMQHADFRNLALTDVRFSDSDLRSSDFTGCTLTNVTFEGTDLRQACFRGVRGQNVRFDTALIEGADFTGADFE